VSPKYSLMQRHNLNVKQIKVTSLPQIEWLIATQQVRPDLQDTSVGGNRERELGDGVSGCKGETQVRRLFMME
jgi:hypothetical protein